MLRARKKSGEQAIGRSRGGPSTKLHAVVDALGNPTRMLLTAGQTHEMRVAEEMLSGINNAYVSETAPTAQRRWSTPSSLAAAPL